MIVRGVLLKKMAEGTALALINGVMCYGLGAAWSYNCHFSVDTSAIRRIRAESCPLMNGY